MKTWTNDEGWTFDFRPRGMDLFSIPSELIFDSKCYELRLCHIAHSDGMTRRVYFLDEKQGRVLNTIGQYKTKEDAMSAIVLRGVAR